MPGIKAFFSEDGNHALVACKYAFAMASTYGERLAQALDLSGKDRQDLADDLSISVQAVSQVLLGKTKALTAENSVKAARFLGVDAYWLATGAGSPQAQAEVPQAWPFRASRAEYERLTPKQKEGLDAVVAAFLAASLECQDDWGRPPPRGVIEADESPHRRRKAS